MPSDESILALGARIDFVLDVGTVTTEAQMPLLGHLDVDSLDHDASVSHAVDELDPERVGQLGIHVGTGDKHH